MTLLKVICWAIVLVTLNSNSKFEIQEFTFEYARNLCKHCAQPDKKLSENCSKQANSRCKHTGRTGKCAHK